MYFVIHIYILTIYSYFLQHKIGFKTCISKKAYICIVEQRELADPKWKVPQRILYFFFIMALLFRSEISINKCSTCIFWKFKQTLSNPYTINIRECKCFIFDKEWYRPLHKTLPRSSAF